MKSQWSWALGAILLPLSLTGTPLDEWTGRLPRHLPPLAVSFADNLYVAVGVGGTILTSTDFVNWTNRNTRVEFRLAAVTHGKGRFVAVGFRPRDKGVIVTSLDGVNWSIQKLTDDTLTAVEYVNGIFVAAGDTGIIRTSVDGLTWTQRREETLPLYAIAYGSGRFAIAGGRLGLGVIMTSTDGVDWKRRTDISVGTVWGIAYGNGMFVATSGAPIFFTSPDGVIWKRVPVAGSQGINKVTFGNGVFISVGNGGEMLTSNDGLAWNLQPKPADKALESIAYIGGHFLLTWRDQKIGQLISEDGIHWRDWTPTESLLARLKLLSFAGETFLATDSAGSILVSTEGKDWSRPRGPTTNEFVQAFAAGNGSFVAIGRRWTGSELGPLILRSPDALAWSEPVHGLKGALHDVAFGAGIFVIAGATADGAGLISTSRDGMTWANQAVPAGLSVFNGIAFGNGKFVAFGPKGVFTSTNGFDWRKPTGNPEIVLDKLKYAGGQFLGFQGIAIYTSDGGDNWVQRSHSHPPFNDVTYAGGVYVGVGEDTFTSLDGVDWQLRSLGNGVVVTYGKGTFVLGDGYLMQSAPLVNIEASPAIERNLGNPLRLLLNSETGLSVVVESSFDLSTWSPVKTFTLKTNPVEVVDESAGWRKRFYRARLGPL